MTANLRAGDDEAVSPVIGVILMVAIGVVLSGVVFVLVSGLSSNKTQTAPTPVLQVDDINDKLSVVSATIGADWTRIQVTATQCTTGSTINIGSSGSSHQNQPAVLGSITAVSTGGCSGINPKVQVTSTSAVISAGDFLAFCTGSGTATNVAIQLTDNLANTVLGTYTFTSIKAC